MRFSLSLALLLASCAPPISEQSAQPTFPLTLTDLWENQDYEGSRLTLTDLQITSDRLAHSPSFYVQEASSVAPLGLRVDLHGQVNLWPPAPGSLVALTGELHYEDGAPRLIMTANDDGEVFGSAPLFYNAQQDAPLHSLVRLDDVQVNSRPDPSGRADTDTLLDLESAFGVELPGWGSRGQLTGIVTGPARVSLRQEEDWSGSWEDAVPPFASLSTIRAGDLEDGSPVYLEALQATPFSRDGRWTVLQDDEGTGIWLDTAHWDMERPDVGSTGTWLVEVRENGRLLRAWDSPVLSGSSTPLVATEPTDGALLLQSLQTLEAPNATGERASEDFLVDDRFMDISALSAPLTVQGAVWLPNEATQALLCPYL